MIEKVRLKAQIIWYFKFSLFSRCVDTLNWKASGSSLEENLEVFHQNFHAYWLVKIVVMVRSYGRH